MEKGSLEMREEKGREEKKEEKEIRDYGNRRKKDLERKKGILVIRKMPIL